MTALRKYWWTLVIALAVFVTACSGNGTLSNVASPSSTSSGTASATPVVDPGAPEGATVPPTPPTPGANATTPQYTLTGSPYGGCVNVTQGMSLQQWLMKVSDAGPRQFHIVAFAQQDPDPGCGATTREARPRLTVDGVYDYTPHSSGQTNFSYNPAMYNCGHVQVDASIIDDITKQDTGLIFSSVFNYGKKCEPPPVPAPSCQVSLSPSTVQVGQNVFATLLITGQATRAKLNGNVVTIPSQGSPVVNITPTTAGIMTIHGEVEGPGGTATCSANLTVTPAPASCTLTATANWDQSRNAVVYRLSVSPAGNGQAMAGFVVDGNTQNPSPVDLNRDLFFGFVQNAQSHNWRLNASYTGGGATCTAQATVVIPQSPICEVVNPPRYDIPVWTSPDSLSRNTGVAATVNVYNAATWKFVLMARDSRTGQVWEKDAAERALSCGESKTLGVSFDWTNHPADKWWTVLYKNGVSVYTSPEITHAIN